MQKLKRLGDAAVPEEIVNCMAYSKNKIVSHLPIEL